MILGTVFYCIAFSRKPILTSSAILRLRAQWVQHLTLQKSSVRILVPRVRRRFTVALVVFTPGSLKPYTLLCLSDPLSLNLRDYRISPFGSANPSRTV